MNLVIIDQWPNNSPGAAADYGFSSAFAVDRIGGAAPTFVVRLLRHVEAAFVCIYRASFVKASTSKCQL